MGIKDPRRGTFCLDLPFYGRTATKTKVTLSIVMAQTLLPLAMGVAQW